MPRQLPPGYTEAPKASKPEGGREMPPGYSLAGQAPSESLLDRLTRSYAAGLKQAPYPEGAPFSEKAAQFVGETGPVIAGAAMGAPGGPLGMIAGAAAGRSVQKATAKGLKAVEERFVPEQERLMSGPEESAGRIVSDVAGTGALQAAGLGATGLVGAAAQKLLPGIIRASSGIPEPVAAAAVKDPGMISRAIRGTGESYEAFERYTGLEGLGKWMARTLTRPSPDLAFKTVAGTANKLARGEAVGPQELYHASQMASQYKSFFPAGSAPSRAAKEWGIVAQSKEMVDDALQKLYPEYEILRKQYFQENVAESFGQVLPQNVNQSPNVLRTTAAIANAVSGIQSGELGRAALSAGAFPAMWGGALRMYAGSPGVIPAARAAIAGSYSPSLIDYYNRKRLP